MPKVSAVIPTYNRAHFLERAIRSVLDQTFQDFEIVVVNDASPENDATDAVVEGFRDPRIKYFRHESNKGIGVTRNTGVLNSSGEYIAFLDDDDAWLPQKLELQCRLLESSPATVGAVYTGGYSMLWKSKKIIRQRIPCYRGNILDALRARNCIGTSSSVMIRKSCFDKVGLFDDALPYGEDFDMWLRLAQRFHFEYLDEPLVMYSLHDVKLSTNWARRLSGAERILEKHGEFFSTDVQRYAGFHFNLGLLYCYNGNIGKSRRALLKAINLSPYQAKFYYYLGISLLGAQGLTQWIRLTKQIRQYFNAAPPEFPSVLEEKSQ
jgi:glycosyltransferase involved in cell wall biosynthesis